MSNEEIAENFALALALDRHREAESGLFGKSFLFQLWLSIVQGILARGLPTGLAAPNERGVAAAGGGGGRPCRS